jgi:hypothetical protein
MASSSSAQAAMPAPARPAAVTAWMKPRRLSLPPMSARSSRSAAGIIAGFVFIYVVSHI